MEERARYSMTTDQAGTTTPDLLKNCLRQALRPIVTDLSPLDTDRQVHKATVRLQFIQFDTQCFPKLGITIHPIPYTLSYSMTLSLSLLKVIGSMSPLLNHSL